MSKPKEPRPLDLRDQQGPGQGGPPQETDATKAEEAREAHESAEARDREASIRDHMVDIGRGNQQAGRQ
ncbi:MAG TPA: hypothetical protein VG406_00470 [Isosphaeraceae bacterium]|jgi:hypothetical protein|nr:hypothetical protein [Isosphaeraceae bacterium]